MAPFVYIAHTRLRTGKLNKLVCAGDNYKITAEKAEKETGCILDTFENVLLKNSLLLVQSDDRMVLMDLSRGETLEQEAQQAWSFAHDLADGPVADRLRDLSPLRAFLPVAEVGLQNVAGGLVDDEEKTRARYAHISISRGKRAVEIGVVLSMRGYQKAYDDLVALLGKAGAEPFLDVFSMYRTLAIDRCDYDPKPQLTLDPEATAINAATTIIRAFMSVARSNEPGVIADHDTEFLHDYRVSFRKVRSVLSLFKGVYEVEKTAGLKAEFSSIMQETNRLRDLDVYLMEKHTYFDMVPEVSLPGVELLFRYLANERDDELKKVVKTLKSKAYGQRLKKLSRLFEGETTIPTGPKGSLPAKDFARKLVLKRYAQVCKIARNIDADTEDSVVHQLRINCKKLRYLMEFFAPLFAKNSIRQLIKRLKVMQDNLGKFNDYSVQQVFLRRIIEENLDCFKGDEMLITEAVGALNAMLFSLQKQERLQVMDNFTKFNSEETKSLFIELFQKKGEE